MSFSSDTIAALATPAGTSAIAVVRASGPQVVGLVSGIFLDSPLPRTACHADYRDTHGQLVDDVLFTYFAAPNSFTGEDTLEVSCHGNPFIAQKIFEDLLARAFGVKADFEIDDALARLASLDLLSESDGRLSVPPLADALARLDKEWDDFFGAGTGKA